jgi:hypothetical protein
LNRLDDLSIGHYQKAPPVILARKLRDRPPLLFDQIGGLPQRI